MKKVEEVFNRYGLGWARVTTDSFYERLEDNMRQEIKKTKSDVISEHRIDSLTREFFQFLFQDACKSLFVYDEDLYLKRHGSAVLFQQMPTVWKDEMRFGYVSTSMITKMYGYLSYRYDPKNTLLAKDEKFNRLVEVCSDTFSEEEKLKHVFDSKLFHKTRKEFLERFVGNVVREAHESEMWDQLKEEIQQEMFLCIKRISKEEGKRVEDGTN